MRPGSIIASEWNQEAPNWSTYEIFGRADISRIRRQMLPIIEKLPKRASIIDLAAGGNNQVYYPPEFNMGRVTAVDISPKLLKINPSGKKIEADIRYPLKLPDSSFDVAICIFAMRYIENQEQVLQEIARIVKNNGLGLIFDYSKFSPLGPVLFNARELASDMAKKGLKNVKTKRVSRYLGYGLDMIAFQK